MLRVFLTNKVERRQFEHAAGPIEFGRGPQRDLPRCVIQDPFVSKDQLSIEELPRGQIQLHNLSTRNPVLVDGVTVGTCASQCFGLPVRVTVGDTLIDVSSGEASDVLDRQSLRTVGAPVGRSDRTRIQSLVQLGESPSAETVAQWFETVVAVQRAAANSAEFYQQTARAVVELVGLDCGLVLLRQDESWQVVARHGDESDRASEFSRNILRFVTEERRTFYQAGTASLSSASLADVTAVVASPVFDAEGKTVVGAVYGSRFRQSGGGAVQIRPLEAQVVQVLAAAVGAGLARMESEAEATRVHVQFEQFFSSDLARELDRDPTMLDGREREVTVLFSDVRGFSRVSERIGPRQTFLLVQDIMERLTARIREHAGVVVDYAGDGLLAMWNAPADQPDHAVRACRAALAMLGEIPGMNAQWETAVGRPLGLGVGLSTGPALVGNTGSRQRLKYGPLGHTVNLASRLEGATKQLGVSALISGSTRQQLGDAFATRRLCRVRVVGIAGAVDVHELHAEPASSDWLQRRDSYEAALAMHEAGRWAEACKAVYPLLPAQDGRYDVPSLTLAGRALECLKAPPDEFDPVVELANK